MATANSHRNCFSARNIRNGNTVGKVERVREKLQLAVSERRTIREEDEQTAKKNEELINDLKEQILQMRAELSRNHVNEVEAESVKVLDLRKRLDRMVYDNNTKAQKIQQMTDELESIVCSRFDYYGGGRGEISISERLENEINAVRLKTAESDLVRRKYKAIKDNILQELFDYEQKINNLEEEIAEAFQEKTGLDSVKGRARRVRKVSQFKLSKLEDSILRSHRMWQKELQTTQLLRQQELDNMETVPAEQQKKGPGNKEASQWYFLVSRGQMMHFVEQEKQIAQLEKVFKNITECSGALTAKDIADRFLSQGDMTEHFKAVRENSQKTVDELMEQNKKLQEEKESLLLANEEDEKISKLDSKIETLQQGLEQNSSQIVQNKQKLDKTNKFITDLRSTLLHILKMSKMAYNSSDSLEKLQELFSDNLTVNNELPSPGSEDVMLSQDDVIELLGSCQDSLKLLVDSLEDTDQEADILAVEKEVTSDIDVNYSADEYTTEVPTSSNNEENSTESEGDLGEVPSRNFIKRQAKQLAEHHARGNTAGRKNTRK